MPGWGSGIVDRLARRWRLWVLLIWIGAAAGLIWYRWTGIHWFALPDTDDNMRLAQVRAWLGGQGWFDLRQYKLDPPGGANIHWSRLVDLPLAAIIVALKPLFGGAFAEKWAVAIAPLLPLGVAMAGQALVVRRLVDPRAFAAGAILLLFCQTGLYMFMPLRIDHHGWQLALLILVIAGLADERPARGGLTVGIATALSLTIGLETLPYLAVAGAAIALRWVWDRGEALRLRAYALALSGGCAIGYAGFASYDNRLAVCDALSPVWLSAMLAAGALLFALSWLRSESRGLRLAAAGIAAVVLAAGFALVWPQCLGRPERVSPELDRLWLSHVREAKPIYEHKLGVIIAACVMPAIGLVGTVFATWRARRGDTFAAWLALLVLALFSIGMLLWQARAAPAAQMIAVPGAAALGWALLAWFIRRDRIWVRVAGAALTVALVTGLFMGAIDPLLPADVATARTKAINRAGARCPTLAALRPIARMPATTIMTFVDLGPRLITVTHHKAIAGPYHRNGAAILDIHHAFGGTPEAARAIAKKHGATLLLVCPNFAESTIYRARAPNGFYGRLAKDEHFAWLDPVPLPKGSPYRLWRIR